MEVKSDLSKVRVGDVLESLSCGRVKVLLVEKGYITCNTAFGTRLWTDEGNPAGDYTLRHPDLYWPGVQIIPADPPKRMKKVTVEKWVALYRQHGSGGIAPYVNISLDGFPYPERMIGEPQRVTWQIEVEDV